MIRRGRVNIDLFERYRSIMQFISIFLLAKLKIINTPTYDRLNTHPSWRVKNTSKAGAEIIIDYFNKYPLFSSKYLDYLFWNETHNIIKNKQHYIKNGIEGLNRIEYLKNNMNNKRVNFN